MSLDIARLSAVPIDPDRAVDAAMDEDWFIILQGSTPVVRRCQYRQFRASKNPPPTAGTCPNDPNGVTPREQLHISELPVASEVYMNDYLIVDQGTPPTTRLLRVELLDWWGA